MKFFVCLFVFFFSFEAHGSASVTSSVDYTIQGVSSTFRSIGSTTRNISDASSGTNGEDTGTQDQSLDALVKDEEALTIIEDI